VTPVVRGWITAPDKWLRRTPIICQLGAKDAVDLELLTDAIEANATDREFFIGKAIGWALRQHAWRDPDWVRAVVEDHPQLSGLSRREATKHLRAAVRGRMLAGRQVLVIRLTNNDCRKLHPDRRVGRRRLRRGRPE